MKECFTPHALMHNLLGVGVGILLVNFVPMLNSVMVGVVVVVVAVVLDYMRK
ncbi:MAG: hypothetical protein Q7S31_01605 [bacterium]|nr:hypothetical protein [bacterium]